MPSTEFAFEAIGTKWRIDIFDDISEEKKSNISNQIKKYIEDFDKDYSRFRSDSLVHKMSLEKGTYDLPLNAKPLFDLYKDLYKITDGAVTPLIGNVLSDAGYDSDYSLQPKTLHTPYSWNEALDYIYPKLIIKKPSILDFGAAGKGYLIDLIGIILHKNNINSFCIDAGGDILYKNNSKKSLRIGLEHPENTDQVIGIVNLHNQSICGSAGNRRKWGNFNHIINPHTLQSPTNILAVWVISETALIADAMTTCLFFTPNDVLNKHFSYEYLILNSDYSIEKSDNFNAELFYKE